jgi:hypothetical protein
MLRMDAVYTLVTWAGAVPDWFLLGRKKCCYRLSAVKDGENYWKSSRTQQIRGE